MYRFYVNDPVRFQKSIRVTIEHGHNNNFENDYTSTAFWYQEDPHKAFPPISAAKDRLPSWPNAVTVSLEKELNLRQQIAGGTIHLNEKDKTMLEKLDEARNKEFRELRYSDFIRDVNAMEKIVKKY